MMSRKQAFRCIYHVTFFTTSLPRQFLSFCEGRPYRGPAIEVNRSDRQQRPLRGPPLSDVSELTTDNGGVSRHRRYVKWG